MGWPLGGVDAGGSPPTHSVGVDFVGGWHGS